MISWFRELDALLRGQKSTDRMLAREGLSLKLQQFIPLAILLGATYGFFMGWYSIIGRDHRNYQQMFASMVKLPALFLITLIVTFPSLYVFNALLGSRLSFVQTLRLLIAAIVVNLAVAASLGPILGFFTLSTTTYSFMVVLNVVILGLSGIVGLEFLMRILRRISFAQNMPTAFVRPVEPTSDSEKTSIEEDSAESPNAEGPQFNAVAQYGESKTIFRIWLIIYGLVGAQTGWLLRPFIGNPEMGFTWFRVREGNVFISIWHHFQGLLTQG